MQSEYTTWDVQNKEKTKLGDDTANCHWVKPHLTILVLGAPMQTIRASPIVNGKK